MARLNSIDPATATGDTKEMLNAVEAKFGMVPNLVKIIANSPAFLKAYLDFGAALSNGTLDAETREAIALTVAGGNGCDYCASAHAAASKMLKVSSDEIDARLAGRSSDTKLGAALAFSRTIIEKNGLVDDNDIEGVRRAGYHDGEITEITGHVIANILTNYVNHIAETDIDFPFVSSKQYRVAA